MLQEITLFFDNLWNGIAAGIMAWNALDYIVAVAAMICIAWGAKRGLKAQALSLFGYIVAFIVASRFYDYFIPWVKKRLFTTSNQAASPEPPADGSGSILSSALMDTVHAVIAFALLFFFVLAGLWLIRFAWSKFTASRPIRTVDRLTGAVLGLIQFVFLWCILYVLLRAWPAGYIRTWVEASVWVDKTGQWIPDVMVEAVKWAQWL